MAAGAPRPMHIDIESWKRRCSRQDCTPKDKSAEEIFIRIAKKLHPEARASRS